MLTEVLVEKKKRRKRTKLC